MGKVYSVPITLRASPWYVVFWLRILAITNNFAKGGNVLKHKWRSGVIY